MNPSWNQSVSLLPFYPPHHMGQIYAPWFQPLNSFNSLSPYSSPLSPLESISPQDSPPPQLTYIRTRQAKKRRISSSTYRNEGDTRGVLVAKGHSILQPTRTVRKKIHPKMSTVDGDMQSQFSPNHQSSGRKVCNGHYSDTSLASNDSGSDTFPCCPSNNLNSIRADQ